MQLSGRPSNVASSPHYGPVHRLSLQHSHFSNDGLFLDAELLLRDHAVIEHRLELGQPGLGRHRANGATGRTRRALGLLLHNHWLQ